MGKKRGKGIWIILGIIVAIIAIFSFTSCLMGRTEVKTSELHSILTQMESGSADAVLDKTELEGAHATQIKQEIADNGFNISQGARISNVLFDGYVIEFDIVSIKTGEVLTFTTNYSRSDSEVSKITALLSGLKIGYSYTDPNAGSIWSSLLPDRKSVV